MNFEDTDFRYEFLDTENPYDVDYVKGFLAKNGYDYEAEDVDGTLIIYNLNDELIGTGSYKNQTLKYVVVSPKFRETTAFPLIVSYLSDKILAQHTRCFVFTRPETAVLFKGIGFKQIAEAKPLFAVLEFGFESIMDYQKDLRNHRVETKTENIAAIVVNCNPFTNGHKYLIEKAASESEILYLFVVEEDFSVFPYKIRREMIEKGIEHLNNVVMIETGPYIVSGGIFPNYFLKLETWNIISEKQAEVDVQIFANYIVPTLGITKRYVGTEHYCRTTRAYNEAMKKILPSAGCELIEVSRKTIGINQSDQKNCISASKIRLAMKENRFDEILHLLPDSTKDFLKSPESDFIWKKLMKNQQHTS